MVGARRPRLIRPRPIFKPDFTPRDDANVRAAVAALERAKGRKRGVRAAEHALVRECELAQGHKDRVVRQNALSEISQHLPEGGEKVVYRAVREETHEGGFSHALVGVFKYAREKGVRPEGATLAAMGDVVCDPRNHRHIRSLALHMLGYGGRGLKSVLLRVAHSSAIPENQAAAHASLVQLGHVPSKRFLLRYIREHPDHLGYAHDLWQSRNRFRWRPAEERELRETMERYHGAFRRRLYDRRWRLGWRRGAVRWLIRLSADGFEFAPKDVKQARRIARISDKSERKDLYEMLREFEQRKRERKAKAKRVAR